MVVLLFAAVLVCGCNFFRDVEDVNLNLTPGGDDSGMPDVGGDATTDAGVGDMPVDVRPDLPDAARFGDPEDNFCNRITKPCNQDFFCSLSFNDPFYEFACRPPDNAGTLPGGEPCQNLSGDCQAGFDCVDWSAGDHPDPRGQVCSPPCLLATGEGCGSGQFCTHRFPEISGVGYCVPSCDPYDQTSCEQGQCSVDPGYPMDTLLPRFRCLTHGGADQKQMGSACDIWNTANDGCPEGLMCYEVSPDSGIITCVTPCQNDDDCAGTGESCPATGVGPWNLRFCGG